MISKELFSKVIGNDIDWCSKHPSEPVVEFHANNTNTICEHINIYELAHKCKEWAFDIGYSVESAKKNILEDKKMKSKWICCGFTPEYNIMPTSEADTEPEAIFKACQWVLENRK